MSLCGDKMAVLPRRLGHNLPPAPRLAYRQTHPSTEKPETARKASAKIRHEATGRNLTSQARLIPVIKFLDALGFSGLFRGQAHHARAHNAQYQLGVAVFLLLVGLMGVHAASVSAWRSGPMG